MEANRMDNWTSDKNQVHWTRHNGIHKFDSKKLRTYLI